MHAIQGAVAVRRERQKRENRRMSQLRRKDSLTGSQLTLMEDAEAKPPKTESSLTAFHLGVVFILLGFLMVFSSMIPDDVMDADSSRLLGVGTTFIIVGLIMVMVNRIITQREEEELTRYVRHRLGRTRSGHALARDLESGLPRQKPKRSKPSATNGNSHKQRHSASGSVPKSPIRSRMHSMSGVERGSLHRLPGRRGHSVDSIASMSIQNGKPPLIRVTTDLALVHPDIKPTASHPGQAVPDGEHHHHHHQSPLEPTLVAHAGEETEKLLQDVPEEPGSPSVMIRTKSGAVVMVPTCVKSHLDPTHPISSGTSTTITTSHSVVAESSSERRTESPVLEASFPQQDGKAPLARMPS